MTRLETRTITMTAEAWNHVEMRAEAALEASKDDLRRDLASKKSFQASQLDVCFNEAILTSIRSAGA